MDWVHCNRCYIQPGELKMKFFITNCGHIYCSLCLQSNQSNECPICHNKYNAIPLTPKMSPDVEMYFLDPVINIQKQIKILEFQQSHRIRLVSHNRERLKKYKSLEKENRDLKKELKICKEENTFLRKEVKRIKEQHLEYKKKLELLPKDERLGSSQSTTGSCSFGQLFKTEQRIPVSYTKIRNTSDDSPSFFQRKISSPNFFLVSESKSSEKPGRAYLTPDIPKFPCNYRSTKISTPDANTPHTPDITYFERDPLQRKGTLSGSLNDPSPSSKIGFHRLTLHRPTSTPNRETTPPTVNFLGILNNTVSM